MYTLSTALILLLALFGVVNAGDDAGDGSGTVPDGAHTLWLPVVGAEYYPNCSIYTRINSPAPNSVFSGTKIITAEFAILDRADVFLWSSLHNVNTGETIQVFHRGRRLSTPYTYTQGMSLPAGRYRLLIDIACFHPKGY